MSTSLSPALPIQRHGYTFQKESKDMRRNTWKSLVAVLALALMVMPVFAKPESKIITLTEPQKFAGKQLREGDYTFKIDDTKVTIELRNKVVAEVTGHWAPRDQKWEYNTFVAGADGQVAEIRLAGEKRTFMVGGM
jgi:hypothetical protein